MLLALPNELLLEIFAALDIKAAIKFSQINKSLLALWQTNENYLIIQILRHQIPHYEDTLRVAIAEIHHELKPPETVSLKELLPRVLDLAAMCSRVSEVYDEKAWEAPSRYIKPTPDLFAKVYYDCLLLTCAHDWPALRGPARRRIKRAASEQNIIHYDMFMCWLLQFCHESDIIDYHDLIRPGDWNDPLHYENPWTDKWRFAMVTIDVYDNLVLVREQGRGPGGYWCCEWGEYQYRYDWE